MIRKEQKQDNWNEHNWNFLSPKKEKESQNFHESESKRPKSTLTNYGRIQKYHHD